MGRAERVRDLQHDGNCHTRLRQSRKVRPRHRCLRPGVLVAAVPLQVPRVADNRVAGTGIRVRRTAAVQLQVVADVDPVGTSGIGHRRLIAQAHVNHHRGDVRPGRHVVVGHPQRRSVLAELRVGVARRRAGGIRIEARAVVVEIPLVRHDAPVRPAVGRPTGIEAHRLIVRHRVRTCPGHGHRLIVIDR